MKSPQNTPETGAMNAKSDEIWGMVHDDPNYSVYGYVAALGLVIYDAQNFPGSYTVQEASLVIAAAESLLAEHSKTHTMVEHSPALWRVPC